MTVKQQKRYILRQYNRRLSEKTTVKGEKMPVFN